MPKAIKRKRKPKEPCSECRLHRDRCICALIPRLDLKTRVCLVVHAKELKRTTNTGQLAIKSLVNSEMRIRGLAGEALDLSDLLTPQYRTYLFYPGDNAVELSKELCAESELPIQLIVPDGNWRQAAKVALRHPELKDVPRLKISAVNLSQWHMRTEHFPEGMATLQAIAYALKVIEGAQVGETLLSLYKAKLHETLRGRGIKID